MSAKSIALKTLGGAGAITALFVGVGVLLTLQEGLVVESTATAISDLNDRLQTIDPKIAAQFAASPYPIVFDQWENGGYSGQYIVKKVESSSTQGPGCFQVATIVTGTPGLFAFSSATAILSGETKHDADNITVWCPRPEGGYAEVSKRLVTANNN